MPNYLNVYGLNNTICPLSATLKLPVRYSLLPGRLIRYYAKKIGFR